MTLASRFSRSLKVIGTDTAQSATDDFPLKFHTTMGPSPCRFRDKQRFQSKIEFFSPPRAFNAPYERVSLAIGHRRSGSKKRKRWATEPRKNFEISSAVWIPYTNATADGLRDGHRATAETARLRIAARRAVKINRRPE